MIRGELAAVTLPNVALLTLPSGRRNCAWLKALNSSVRNSRFIPSLIAVSFSSAMSQLFKPGPEKNRRLAFPNVPMVSGLNRDVLKYGFPERGSLMLNEPGVKFGVSTGSEIAPALLVPSKELSSVSVRVTGRPVENLVMPLSRQPLPAGSAHQGDRRATGSHS